MSEPPQQRMPIDFEELDFAVENEEWNEYELKDGSTIKGRVILQKVTRDPYNHKNVGFKVSQPLWVVWAPPQARGEANIRAGEPIAGSKYEVRVNKSNEPWNVYRILKTGQKIKIKLALTEVNRFVDKFDADGIPVYEVPAGISIAVSHPDKTPTS